MDHFNFFNSYRETCQSIPKEYRADFYDAIMDYAFDGTEPDFGDNWGLTASFKSIKRNIDSGVKIAKERSEAGKKGRSKQETAKQNSEDFCLKQNETKESSDNFCLKQNETEQELASSEREKEREREIEKEKEKEGEEEGEEEREGEKGVQREKHKRFSPPSLSEVQEYCSERQNNVDPETFIAYYESQGWKKANGTKVVDWKGCVRTWENRDNGYSKIDRPPNKKTGGIYAASMSGYGYVTADGEIVSG